MQMPKERQEQISWAAQLHFTADGSAGRLSSTIIEDEHQIRLRANRVSASGFVCAIVVGAAANQALINTWRAIELFISGSDFNSISFQLSSRQFPIHNQNRIQMLANEPANKTMLGVFGRRTIRFRRAGIEWAKRPF